MGSAAAVVWLCTHAPGPCLGEGEGWGERGGTCSGPSRALPFLQVNACVQSRPYAAAPGSAVTRRQRVRMRVVACWCDSPPIDSHLRPRCLSMARIPQATGAIHTHPQGWCHPGKRFPRHKHLRESTCYFCSASTPFGCRPVYGAKKAQDELR